jgi:hypothetical protein
VVLAAAGVLVLLCVAGGALAWFRVAQNGTAPTSAAAPRAPATSEAVLGLPAQAPPPEAPASATFDEQSRIPGYQSSFYVLGFVTNTSPFSLEKPKITAVLLDKSGKEQATRDGFAESDVLAPQAIAPIKILISDPPAHSSIKFEVVARKASYFPEAAAGLRLEVLEAPHATFGSSWEVTGKVVNGGSRGARFVNIQVQAFDAASHLIGLDSTYVDGEAIAPGASGRFRAMPLYEKPPHHFKYTVSGQVVK